MHSTLRRAVTAATALLTMVLATGCTGPEGLLFRLLVDRDPEAAASVATQLTPEQMTPGVAVLTPDQFAAVVNHLRAMPAEPAQGVWDRLAACESGGNWSINTGNGYYGGLQFLLSTWRSVGGSGYPHENSRAEQIHRAEILLAQSGWGQWPVCSRRIGMR